jgi:hypothetical protein
MVMLRVNSNSTEEVSCALGSFVKHSGRNSAGDHRDVKQDGEVSPQLYMEKASGKRSGPIHFLVHRP